MACGMNADLQGGKLTSKLPGINLKQVLSAFPPSVTKFAGLLKLNMQQPKFVQQLQNGNENTHEDLVCVDQSMSRLACFLSLGESVFIYFLDYFKQKNHHQMMINIEYYFYEYVKLYLTDKKN